jgi:hypothetical protein
LEVTEQSSSSVNLPDREAARSFNNTWRTFDDAVDGGHWGVIGMLGRLGQAATWGNQLSGASNDYYAESGDAIRTTIFSMSNGLGGTGMAVLVEIIDDNGVVHAQRVHRTERCLD